MKSTFCAASAALAGCPKTDPQECTNNAQCDLGEACRDGACVVVAGGEGEGDVAEGEGDVAEGEGDVPVGEGEGEGEDDVEPNRFRISNQRISVGTGVVAGDVFRARVVVGAPRSASGSLFRLTTNP